MQASQPTGQEIAKVAVPRGEVVAHRVHVGSRDRVRCPHDLGWHRVGRRGIGRHVQDGGLVGLVRGKQQAQRRTAAAGAREFDERQIVSMGEDADPTGRDTGATRRARDTVRDGAEAIAGMHRRQV